MQVVNDHKISTLRGVSLKICILAKSNTVIPFLEFIKPELQVHLESCDQLFKNTVLVVRHDKKN